METGMAVQKAANMFDVPITTLKDRVNGRIKSDVVKSGPSPLFSQEQETMLSRHLNTMAELGYGYSRMETINLATDYAINLDLCSKDNPLSLQWLRNFLDRWPELKVRKPRSLEAARARCATGPVIERYFKELVNVLDKHNFKERPNAIYNLDEKGLSTDHKPPKIVSGVAYKPQAITSGKSQTITVIGRANASGNQVPPFCIFPGKRLLDDLMEGATPGATGTVSDYGWSNTEIYRQYVQTHLVKYLPTRSPESPALVLYDGHQSHISIGLIEWAQNNHIILFVLPPHCSHLLQPLDVSCYGPFETAWNAACHGYLRQSGGKAITRYEVCKIACNVYSATLTPSNIQSAFKKCGFFPFDPKVISDSLVAPSLSFAIPDASDDSCKTNNIAGTGEQFLESRGREILKNVKAAKVRKTLSRVVAGKPITAKDVVQQIKDHIESQASNKRKSTTSNSVAGTSGHVPQKKTKKPSAKKSATSIQHESDTDDSEPSDEEKCCVCGKFCPEEMKRLPYIKFAKWGECEDCGRWVHLQYCTSIRVISRGDNFFCPDCTRKRAEQ